MSHGHEGESVVLNNRELALLIWLGVVVVFVLANKSRRSGFGPAFRSGLHPKILVPLASMVGYVALLVWLGATIGLWRSDILKDTVVWVIISGLALFGSFPNAAKQPHYFRNRLAAALGISAFLEFFANLYVLNLAAELVLQPFLALLAMVSVVAGHQQQRTVKRLVDTVLTLIGVPLLLFAIGELISTWSESDKAGLLRQLALPVWLTAGLLPFIYLLSLYATYEHAFNGIDFATKDRAARRRAKLALVATLGFKHRDVHAFSWNWGHQAATATNFGAARQVVADFLQSRRDKERAAREEQERLRRYAGSTGVDADGLRRDRREFKETMRALDWLATCQMGWHRNRGGRYRPELLEVLGDGFTRRGLPSESGITMKVADDGQSWYAWRRTVTGWCFAIGAAGPPPDQRRYDGPQPPQGFPGTDPAWGANTFTAEVNRNWV